MKVMFCEIQNFKGIKHQVIEFDGKSAWLIGGNGQGKSSVIDAMLSAVDTEYIPASPIHEGEQRGSIKIKIAGIRNGQPDEYTIDLTFSPSKRTGTMKVKNKDGFDMGGSGKTIIKDIFGRVSFDIYEFLTDKKEDQIKTLKKLTGCEVDLDSLDAEIRLIEDKRKNLAREIAEFSAVNKRENRPFNDNDIEMYAKPVDEGAIAEKLTGIAVEQGMWQKQSDGVRGVQNMIETNISLMDNMNEEIKELELSVMYKKQQILNMTQQNKEHQDKIDKAVSWMERNPRPTTTSVTEELADARKHNEMNRIIESYSLRQREMHKKQTMWEECDENIKTKRAHKVHLISKSQLPVEGLSFTENEITLHGIPIEQVNTQTKLDLGADITIAMKKPLRLAMIREGSLYDIPHLKKTLEKFDSMGIQWIVEWVRPEGGPLEIKFEEKDI